LIEFETGYSVAVDWKDGSVYTGTAGVEVVVLYMIFKMVTQLYTPPTTLPPPLG